MKQFTQLTLTLITLFTTACSTPTPTNSSQTDDKKSGFLQRHLDNWLKDDWEPAVKEKEKKENSKRFRLQDYVDKAALYMKAHPNDYNNSNVKKLDALPVIGK